MQAALDSLDAQVEAAQAAADAENADSDGIGLFGRVNPATLWDHLTGRDATDWDNLAERAAQAEAKAAAEREDSRLPDGWRI